MRQGFARANNRNGGESGRAEAGELADAGESWLHCRRCHGDGRAAHQVGGTLARVGWGAVIRSAKQTLNEGKFDDFATAAPHPDLMSFFRDDMKKRPS